MEPGARQADAQTIGPPEPPWTCIIYYSWTRWVHEAQHHKVFVWRSRKYARTRNFTGSRGEIWFPLCIWQVCRANVCRCVVKISVLLQSVKQTTSFHYTLHNILALFCVLFSFVVAHGSTWPPSGSRSRSTRSSHPLCAESVSCCDSVSTCLCSVLTLLRCDLRSVPIRVWVCLFLYKKLF